MGSMYCVDWVNIRYSKPEQYYYNDDSRLYAHKNDSFDMLTHKSDHYEKLRTDDQKS